MSLLTAKQAYVRSFRSEYNLTHHITHTGTGAVDYVGCGKTAEEALPDEQPTAKQVATTPKTTPKGGSSAHKAKDKKKNKDKKAAKS